MRIAVTYDNGEVFGHFGHTEQFKVYEVEDGKVVSSSILSSGGQGHGALAILLSGNGIDALICGGIGPGARNALASLGIQLMAGVAGSADAAVEAYLAGTLEYSADANCDHHGEGHTCGGHHHEDGHTCGGHHHEDGHSCGCRH